MFAISRGTDDAFLWKATIRIAYVKVNPETKEIIETHLMNLKDYLFVLKMFEQNIKKLKEVQVCNCDQVITTAIFIECLEI